MAKQEISKQSSEFACLRAAQECLAGFPEGRIRSGDDPPDCYVAMPNGSDSAFELTEQIDQLAADAAALAKKFIVEAKDRFFRMHPEHRTGWIMSLSPGDVFEQIAAQSQRRRLYRKMKDDLIDRFVSLVEREVAKRHSFEWRLPGEPIWTFSKCDRVHPQELTRMYFTGAFGYDCKSRDRIENTFGRDVTFKPSKIQERITAKASGLRRYACRPAYLLISAPLFPRSVQSAGSFCVLKTPESIVDHRFNIGGFTAVFLHDLYGRSYRIGEDGRALESPRKRLHHSSAE